MRYIQTQKYLKNQARRLGYTQLEFCKRYELNTMFFSHILNHKISIKNLKKLSKAFDVEYEDLFDILETLYLKDEKVGVKDEE